MSLKRIAALFLTVAMLTVAGCSSSPSQSGDSTKPVELSFYYPIAVGGPLTKVIEGMTAEFTKANPNIKVTPIFSGNYADTLTKVQTLLQGGEKPDVAVVLSTDVYTLVDQDAVLPLDDLIKNDPDGQKYIDDFYPAFMANSRIGTTTYGIPFQRSTIVMYYNKDLFQKAGIKNPPKTWDEMMADAKLITDPAQDIRGIEIPSDGYAYWLAQPFAIQAGKNVMNRDGTEVYFNSPENVQAFTFMRSLVDQKVMPGGVIAWASAPTDFISGKVGMIYHTTGSLTNITAGAKFPFGVAMLPAGPKGFGTPTGGGNMYIFKGLPKEQQDAAWKFVKFMTEPEQLAQWSIATGYVAPRKSAYDTQTLKDFIAKNPDYLVARDQLQYAQAELSTHNNQQIYKLYGDQIQAIFTGQKSVQDALDQAQKDADAILSKFRKK